MSETVRVLVAGAEGSTPRETGAVMHVARDTIAGTIGGGALELEAIRVARKMLAAPVTPWRREVLRLPLGPSLGQCCGGSVTLLLERGWADACEGLVVRPLIDGAPATVVTDRKQAGPWPLPVTRALAAMLSGEQPQRVRIVQGWVIEPAHTPLTPLVLYGAGHVGRALVRVLDGLPFAITWADTAPERFPADARDGVTLVPAADLTTVALAAPADAMHLVMTYSHAIDLAVCHAILVRGDFGHLGLIGSATKCARFRKRLAEFGHSPAAIDRLVCPIGLPGLVGKAPAAIAISVAADLLQRRAARSANVPSTLSAMAKDV